MHYNLHPQQHACIPLSSKKFAKQGGLAPRYAGGLWWVDPNHDPRDPAQLSWIVGWLVLALKSRGLVSPEGNGWAKVYAEV
jgi:hypothetical protein